MTKNSLTTLKDLSELLGGELFGISATQAALLQVSGIAAIDKAGPKEVSFLINPEYMKYAATTRAAAVIVGKQIDDCSNPQILHKNPYWAFAKTAQLFAPDRVELGEKSGQAYISPSAKLGKNVSIYPFVYLSDGCEIGDDCVLFPGVYIGRNAKIGNNCILRASVTIEDGIIVGDRVLIHGNAVIGADGFGFAPGSDDIAKIPQVGIVRIGDDVEIGGGSTIDRAAMGETLIGNGCKLDSSIHIAHNVQLGEHTMMCGGAFVAGSAKVGKWNILAGSSSVNNHVVLADRVTVGALAGVTKSLSEPGEYMGFPAIPAGEWRRQVAGVRRLKELTERVRRLEDLLVKTDKLR